MVGACATIRHHDYRSSIISITNSVPAILLIQPYAIVELAPCRYITLVAEQDPAIGDLHITMPPTGIQRGGFDVAAFLKRYKLNPVGLHYFTVTAGQ